jgi:ferredoxin
VTSDGEEYLAAWINDLRCTRDEIDQFIETYTRQEAAHGRPAPTGETRGTGLYRIDQALCAGCEACVPACPAGAIAMTDGRAAISTEAWRECGECVAVCPQGAIRWTEAGLAGTATTLAAATPPAPVALRPQHAEVPPAAGSRSIWRSSFWPALGSALVWAGRELLPELLRAWGQTSMTREAQPADALTGGRSGRRGGRRHRWG